MLSTWKILLLIGAPVVSGFAGADLFHPDVPSEPETCGNHDTWLQSMMAAFPEEQAEFFPETITGETNQDPITCSTLTTDMCNSPPQMIDLICADTCKYSGTCKGDEAVAVLNYDPEPPEDDAAGAEPITCESVDLMKQQMSMIESMWDQLKGKTDPATGNPYVTEKNLQQIAFTILSMDKLCCESGDEYEEAMSMIESMWERIKDMRDPDPDPDTNLEANLEDIKQLGISISSIDKLCSSGGRKLTAAHRVDEATLRLIKTTIPTWLKSAAPLSKMSILTSPTHKVTKRGTMTYKGKTLKLDVAAHMYASDDGVFTGLEKLLAQYDLDQDGHYTATEVRALVRDFMKQQRR